MILMQFKNPQNQPKRKKPKKPNPKPKTARKNNLNSPQHAKQPKQKKFPELLLGSVNSKLELNS